MWLKDYFLRLHIGWFFLPWLIVWLQTRLPTKFIQNVARDLNPQPAVVSFVAEGFIFVHSVLKPLKKAETISLLLQVELFLFYSQFPKGA